MTLTGDEVLRHLGAELGCDVAGAGPASPLFSAGIVDSFALVALVSFIEARTGITILPEDMTLENLDSAERILAFVERARARARADAAG